MRREYKKKLKRSKNILIAGAGKQFRKIELRASKARYCEHYVAPGRCINDTSLNSQDYYAKAYIHHFNDYNTRVFRVK